jgi:FkbM family methyltransferase
MDPSQNGWRRVSGSTSNKSGSFSITCRGRTFHALDTPLVHHAAAEFGSGFEEGTLRFFDAVLPRCDRMFDCGAYIGFTALYAASAVAQVHAFEPSPANFALLQCNIAFNEALASRIAVHNHALGEADGTATIYVKGVADSGASLRRDVQRDRVVHGHAEAVVPVRAATPVLSRLGLDARSLLKIDIEGAEYDVVPNLAGLLEERRPFVHISFHPFNVVISDDEYVNAVARLRSALTVAEALSHYRFMYMFTADGWVCIDPPSRPHFLRHYLLAPKSVPRIATAQYGFTDAVGFSDEPLDELGG